MNHLIVGALICLGSMARAQEAPKAPAELDASGITGLLADKIKEARGGVLVTLGGKPGGAAYLPIWSWHTLDGTPIAEFPTIGYRAVQDQRPDAFTTATVNIPGLSARVFGSKWMTDHVTKSAFPPIFFGPALIVPLDLRTVRALRWDDWQKYASVVVSVRISAKPLQEK